MPKAKIEKSVDEMADVIEAEMQEWTPAPDEWSGVVHSSFGEAPEEVKEPLPSKIRMTHLHGFVDDNGMHRQWHGGNVISNPHEIALLVERGARFEVI